MVHRYIMIALAVLGMAGMAWAQEARKERGLPIEITSDGENRFEGGMAVATGNVVVRYGADIIYADRVTYDTKAREAMADGNVRIYSGDKIYRGQQLRFNFDTKHVVSSDFGIVDYPLMASGKSVATPEDNHYTIREGSFTTDNREKPSYRLKANTVEIYPDNEVVLKNVVVYIGDVPVMWVPVFVQSLKSETSAYSFELGSSSRFGAYFYNTYNWVVDANLAIGYHFDLREKRGLAGGLDIKFKPTRDGDGLIKAYYAADEDHLYNPSFIPRSPVNKERYRLTLQQRVPFGNDVNVLTDLNVLSDPYINQDFFRNDFRDDRMPDNVGEASLYNQNFTASLLFRKQVNRFDQVVERLPEFKVETKRVKMFGTDIAYEGETSMANFRQEFSNQTRNISYDAYRWDTLHQFLYPRQYFSWLSLTPRVGLRGTYWSDDNLNINDTRRESAGRAMVLAGGEASFKVAKTWSETQNPTLGIYGLRHVVEPFTNFQYIPSPDIDSTELRGFDSRVRNTWASPINLTSYNSVDSIDRQAVVRHGVRNKLQTRRDGQNWDLADWAVFADLNLDRHYNEQNQLVDDKYSNIYNDLKINPLPWLSFRSQSAVDTYSSRYAMSDNSLTWQATKFYELTVGNRMLDQVRIRDDRGVLLPDSNLIYLRNFYRMNENWQFEARQSFEVDDGKLEEMDYTLYRDLTSWQVALTLAQRDFRERSVENSIYMTWTLKAFPEAKFSLSQ